MAFSSEIPHITYSLDKCLLLCEVSQKSIGGISSDILEFLQKVLIMHELKTGFNADKFATFWMLPESFYRLFAGASMPSTAIFLRARAETKNLPCEQRAV